MGSKCGRCGQHEVHTMDCQVRNSCLLCGSAVDHYGDCTNTDCPPNAEMWAALQEPFAPAYCYASMLRLEASMARIKAEVQALLEEIAALKAQLALYALPAGVNLYHQSATTGQRNVSTPYARSMIPQKRRYPPSGKTNCKRGSRDDGQTTRDHHCAVPGWQ